LGPTPTLELCQTGNFICNSKGQLVKASLGFAGFKCPLPAEELSALTALQTLDVDYNDFQGATMNDLAQVGPGGWASWCTQQPLAGASCMHVAGASYAAAAC
jgi:hypothetical protein